MSASGKEQSSRECMASKVSCAGPGQGNASAGDTARISFAAAAGQLSTGERMSSLPGASGIEPPAPPLDSRVAQSEPPVWNPRGGLGTALVLISFLISVGGGIGFLVVYWTGGPNTLLGTMLSFCLLGFGCALVFWSHWLMRQTEVSAPRELLPEATEDCDALVADFSFATPDVQRRRLVLGLATTVMAALAAASISILRSFFESSPYGPPLESRIWKRGQRLITDTGEVANIHTLDEGGSVIVFPENQGGYVSAQTVLLRVPQEFLRLPKARARWAPMGYLAYSRVCTHAGCPVGLFEAENDLLLCPCHQSSFNVLNGAQPTGGPAARPLPQLPLYVDKDGNLRAGGGFTAPPGPGYWSI